MTYALIAAHNEEARIGRVLEALPQDVKPIVATNGCEDQTADIARDMGAITLDLEEQGKLPAIQYGLRFLGSRAVGDPILMIDADCWPVFPKQWAASMSQHMLSNVNPAFTGVVTTGPNIARAGPSVASNVLRSGRRYVRQWQFVMGDHNQRLWRGSNMGLVLHSQRQLDALLDMPHFWPGEDHAIKDAMERMGAIATQSVHPFSAVYQEARYVPSYFDVRRLSREARIELEDNLYRARAAEGSRPYDGDLSFLDAYIESA